MKSNKAYVAEINKEIERLHDVAGIAYRDLPKRINKREAAKMSREGLQAYRKQVFSDEARHVTKKDGRFVSQAKEQTEKIKRADKINRDLAKVTSKMSEDVDIPDLVDLKNITYYSERFLTAKEKALNSPNAKKVYERADKSKVSGVSLAEVQEFTKAGNEQKEEFKDYVFDKMQKNAEEVKKTGGVPFQIGSDKLRDLDPSHVPTEDELLRADRKSFEKKIGASQRHANRALNTDNLRMNLKRAAIRSNIPNDLAYNIVNQLETIGSDDLLELFYTGQLDFSYIYSNEEAEKKGKEIFSHFGKDPETELKYNFSSKKTENWNALQEGFNPEYGKMHYKTRLFYDERTQAERVMEMTALKKQLKTKKKGRR